MTAATISWMTSLSWILPLFVTLASEQNVVCWCLDYWLHRWTRLLVATQSRSNERHRGRTQRPHLGFIHFCARKESDGYPGFWLPLCTVLLVHVFPCPRCPPWCSPLTLCALPLVDWTNAHVHVTSTIAGALPSLEGRRTKGTLWSECQRSGVRRSHFHVTRLNTINPLFVFSARSISAFCFHQ